MTIFPHSYNRRDFLRQAGLAAMGTTLGASLLAQRAKAETITLPFANGERELVAYPQKRPLIRLTARPPQLETPFAVFNEGILTPNDAFFVRYHLAGIPVSIDASAHRLRVKGQVARPLELSIDELKRLADPVELVAVNQCSGNSRGFFEPRVPGGQMGNGAMGNARWTGIPLKAVLEKAGVAAGAKQVTFEGLDRPVLESTPAFIKALDLDHALDGEVMVAYAMNGEELPFLNGFPLRLVVPGWYGTYWVKHLADLTVLDAPFTGYWMSTAYRIPDNPTHSVAPGQTSGSTIPINRCNVRSFITSLADGSVVPAGRPTQVRGIAFDGGNGIGQVLFSADGGQRWRPARLGPELSRYSFREWKIDFTPARTGTVALQVQAVNRQGETQPAQPRWNGPGYMRNVIESITVRAA